MDTEFKIAALGQAAKFDVCQASDIPSDTPPRDALASCVFHAVKRGGGCTPLLKVLQSNVCERDCAYCANRSGRDTRRTTLTPEELARTFDDMVRRRLVEGLFLSSGMCGHADQAMGRMLATVDLIRNRYAFRGYVHLKILPGADPAAISAALALADRVSVNLEAPTPERLQVLSRTKDYGRELWTALETAERTRRDERRRVSMTTQFVVGAAGEEDRELLGTAGRLYRDLGLARVYYSAFRPVSDTPLEGHAPAPLWRQNRLYQADMLLSLYGFTPDELVYDARGMLSRDDDPKVAWARAHPERFPVEVNRASKEDLLRVPGIGPTSAERIVRWRREGALTDLAQVGKAGAAAKRAAPYVLLNGRRPVHQMALW
jgi:predicted DNA-binding helix-hairpin-helix protein